MFEFLYEFLNFFLYSLLIEIGEKESESGASAILEELIEAKEV